MLTEDTGTQGKGRFELELGVAQARDSGSRALEFGPQLSYGAVDTLDLIVRPTWLNVRLAASAGGTHASDLGDTGVDFKCRFYDADSLSLGVRAGVDTPTGNDNKGLGTGKTSPHAILIATYDASPWSLSANVDWVYDPLVGDRRQLWGGSVAALGTFDERWKFSAEVGAASNPDATRGTWPAIARFGAIAALAPGLDVDAGWQVRLNRAAPSQMLLVGATLRW